MQKARVNGIDINYNVKGEGDPLILIMGFGGGSLSWFFQIRAFKKHYRVVTFNNRNIGETGKADSSYTLETMADDTIILMDHLKIDKAHVLGYSLGGAIAQEIAINYPQRVRKLILASTFSGWEGEMSDITSSMSKNLDIKEGFSGKDIKSLDARKFAGSIASLSFNMRLFRAVSIPVIKIRTKLASSENLMSQLEAAAGCNTLSRLYLIQAPTLIITGAKDRLVSPQSSELMASKIPNAKLVKLEKGSHLLIVESFRRFNNEVLNFLRND